MGTWSFLCVYDIDSSKLVDVYRTFDTDALFLFVYNNDAHFGIVCV